MAKFGFRLQSVLNLRTQIEDKLKNELGKAIQKLEGEKQKLAEIETALDDTVQEFNNKAKKATVYELVEFNEYLALLNSRLKKQKERVNCAAQIVDKIREELLKAVKEKKILEKLREKRYSEFLSEEKKLEQIINDEIVSFKHKKSDAGD